MYSGPYLQSATNPENGTVTYTYNTTNNKIATKTDAKGQVVKYTYDTYARLTEVQRYPQGLSNAEDTCQQEQYFYDTNPFDSSYSGSYTNGRLTAVQYYGGSSTYNNGASACDTTFIEMYNYSQPGGKIGKRLRLQRTLEIGHAAPTATNLDFNSTYVYDTEGRMTTVQYPGSGPTSAPVTGPNLGWAFDSMGRVNTMTDLAANSTIISGATYGPSNELLTMSGQLNESRSYNSMLQLTSLASGSTVSMIYAYSSAQNNGKITSQTDAISGETVQYTYDALNRLASATATNSSWGQSYQYDGFGNLTNQNVTAGSAPSYSTGYDANNHGSCVDGNGNNTCQVDGAGHGFVYDVENRPITLGNGIVNPPFRYGYAPGNRRVWRGLFTSGTLTTDEVTFWGVNGQKLAVYQLTYTNLAQQGQQANYVWYATQTGTNYYFGSKLVKNASGYVGRDRLGSIGKFYPWGQEKPSATTNGTEKFTGYFRDAETGLDYAVNRYHDPGTGRFMTPDPYMASGGPTDPGSWNRYAYTRGDPINRFDRGGTCDGDSFATDPNGGDDGDCQDNGGGLDGDGGCVVYGFVPIASSGCEAPPDPTPSNPTPAPSPTCSITLFSRSVAHTGGTANHTYLDVTEVSGSGTVILNDVLEGGPQHPHNFLKHPKASWGNLVGFTEPVPPAGTPIPPNTFLGSTNPGKNTAIGSDTGGADVCDMITALLADVSDYQMSAGVAYSLVPNGTTTFNSNSFTFTLLYDIGLSKAFASSIFSSPGWGFRVPGLN